MANPQTKNSKKVSERLQAHTWLCKVLVDGRSLNNIFNTTNADLSASESSFAKQIVYGSVRYYHQIKAILDQLLEKPLKQKDTDIYAILIMGVYQLKYMSVPDHAALSESVELTRQIQKSWASKLVNGVLRNYRRKTKEIDNKLAKAKTYQFSHPNWIINQVEADWGSSYSDILNQNNLQAPMTLRVNSQQVSLEDYQQQLKKAGIESANHPIAYDALILDKACNVSKLPGFEQGLASVQDAAAQLVVELMDLEKADSLKILDACAAPGGKTAHILQRNPNIDLTAIELSTRRITKIENTLARLQLKDKVNLICADLLDTTSWWDGNCFDRILLDVPCSASGVIRRNPDIKFHRTKQDLQQLTKLQQQMLDRAWELLKPGGKLVYATCSVFKDENENQVNAFIKKTGAIDYGLPQKLSKQLNQLAQLGHQIFPGEAQMDGFYLCGLEKPRIKD